MAKYRGGGGTKERIWKRVKGLEVVKRVKKALNAGALDNAILFVLFFLVIFLVFVYVLNPLFSGVWESIAAFHAEGAHKILDFLGEESYANGNILIAPVGGTPIRFVVSQLCSGDVEVAVLAALILATISIPLFWRLVGAVFGAIVIIALNPFRIALTIYITASVGLEAGDFYHSVIFRLFLFFVLLLYYFIWFRLVEGREPPIKIPISRKKSRWTNSE